MSCRIKHSRVFSFTAITAGSFTRICLPHPRVFYLRQCSNHLASMTYTIVVHYAKPHGNYLRTGGRKRQPQLDNLGLADWQLSGELKGSFGSACDRPRFELMAGKRPVKFRFLSAASRHWVLLTLCCPSLGTVVTSEIRTKQAFDNLRCISFIERCLPLNVECEWKTCLSHSRTLPGHLNSYSKPSALAGVNVEYAGHSKWFGTTPRRVLAYIPLPRLHLGCLR